MIRRIALTLVIALLPAVASAALPRTQTVAGARLAQLATKVATALVVDPDRAVSPAFPIGDQSVPLGSLAIRVGAPQVNPTYIAVPIAIDVDGVPARTVFAGYRVTQYVRTAVAAHDLAPGAVLAPDDLQLARVLSNGRGAVDIASLVGRKVRAASVRGALLFVEQTSVVELVRAGEGAILIVHDGPASLTADVVARTGGGLGETATVYNPQTRKSLSGIITAPNRVELTLPEAQ